MGKTMIYLAWAMLLGLLTFTFSNYLEKQNNPNQQVDTQYNNEVAEVRLKQNRYGHYVATGATLISIPSSVAQKLQLEKGYPSQSRTANGTITVYTTRLDLVSIGAIELKNIRATINPHMEGDEILLGMSFMKHLEMTQKGKLMILRY